MPIEISWGRIRQLQGILKRCSTTSNMDENREIMNSMPTQAALEKTFSPGIQLSLSLSQTTWEKCGFSFLQLIGKESFLCVSKPFSLIYPLLLLITQKTSHLDLNCQSLAFGKKTHHYYNYKIVCKINNKINQFIILKCFLIN